MPNCKIGDLVRYVGKNESNRPNVYGWIGKTISSFIDKDDGCLVWVVDPPLPGGDITRYKEHKIVKADWVADHSLKPIRGGEGQDEMLKLVGKPVKKEKESV